MIYGHSAVRELLPQLPAALLLGPRGVGKFSLASEIAEVMAPVDHVIHRHVTADRTRALPEWLSMAPINAPFRVAVLDLDNASEAALQALLKTLEEPGPYGRIWIAATNPPATVVSRCTILPCYGLQPAELSAAMQTTGMAMNRADAIAPIAEGSVETGLRLAEVLDARARVLSLLKAVVARNWTLVAQVLRGVGEDAWTEDNCRALDLWLSDLLAETTRWYPAEFLDPGRGISREQLLGAHHALARPGRPGLRMTLAAQALLRR